MKKATLGAAPATVIPAGSGSSAEVGAESQVRLEMWRAILLVAAGLVVPAAYVVGVAYHEAWLEVFGLPSDLFPLSFEQVMYAAYFALVAPALQWSLLLIRSGGIAVLAMVWVSALLLHLILRSVWSSVSGLVRRRISNAKRWLVRWEIVGAARATHRFLSAPLWALLFLLYVPVYAVVPALLGHYSGKYAGSEARRMIELGSRGHDASKVPFEVFEGNVGYPGLLCGQAGCAVFRDGAAVFVKWEKITAIKGRAPGSM